MWLYVIGPAQKQAQFTDALQVSVRLAAKHPAGTPVY